jgi:hypothetical protein
MRRLLHYLRFVATDFIHFVSAPLHRLHENVVVFCAAGGDSYIDFCESVKLFGLR